MQLAATERLTRDPSPCFSGFVNRATRPTTREDDAMNGYKAFYRGKAAEVLAKTAYEAQQKAAIVLKAKKSYEVTVVLCEKEGEQVTHSTSQL